MALQRTECRGCFAAITYEPQTPQPGVFCPNCGSLALGDPSLRSEGRPVEAVRAQPAAPVVPAPVAPPAAVPPPADPAARRRRRVILLVAGAVVLLVVCVGVPMMLVNFLSSARQRLSALHLRQIGVVRYER